jgi:NADP-dependent 3-hydroxy acid dehydrogenase YdfG
MMELRGKVAVVTGASKGMGRHFVGALVREGMKVAALARPSDALAGLSAEFGEAVHPVPCDVADPGQVNAAVAEVVRDLGRIDLVVNNAAVFFPFEFEQASDEDVRRHVDINVLGPIWMIRAAIPHLRATKGQVVTISSESVKEPAPLLALYAATKAAVEVLSDGLRSELRGDGIRVTVLRSGSVKGSSGSENWSPEGTQAFYRKIVETGFAQRTGEGAEPESMAAALVAAVSLPRDVSVDEIVVRSARAGIPAGAATVAGAT